MNRRNSEPTELVERLHEVAEKAARATSSESLLLGVESDDGALSTRVALGSAAPSDAYFIASITKMFTASIVMQLIDEQRLSLDDRLVDLLPDLELGGIHRHKGVDHTSKIRLRHLVHQTSGLPDYFAGELETEFKHNRDRRYSIDDVLDMARRKPAQFEPGDRNGTRSAYSDTNYQLLTAIIETATGGSYTDAVEQRIAARVGLEDTYLAGQPPAQGQEPLELHHKDQPLDLPDALASEQGAGGIVSTLDDQLRFSRAYHQDQLFDPRHNSEMRRWNRIFFPIDYGHGLMRYRLPRWLTGFRRSPELVGHSGSTNSFCFYAPELHCHIVGTLNQLDKPSHAFRLMARVAGTRSAGPALIELSADRFARRRRRLVGSSRRRTSPGPIARCRLW